MSPLLVNIAIVLCFVQHAPVELEPLQVAVRPGMREHLGTRGEPLGLTIVRVRQRSDFGVHTAT